LTARVLLVELESPRELAASRIERRLVLRINRLVERLRDQQGVDGVILGGTELPLLLTTPDVAGLPTLDTTALHVAAIVARLRAGIAPRNA